MVMVISLQYLIGKRITHQHLHLWLAGGLGASLASNANAST